MRAQAFGGKPTYLLPLSAAGHIALITQKW